MDILSGLAPQQIAMLRHCRTYREVSAGQMVFQQGDPADSLFIVVSGSVEAFRKEGQREVSLAHLGPHEAFGEMGFLIQSGRTASVRALEDSLLFEIPANLIDVMLKACEPPAAMKLLQNLICVLAERLRRQNAETSAPPDTSSDASVIKGQIEAAQKVLERALPALKKFSPKQEIEAGSYLFRQGEDATCFFLIHEGTLDVLREEPQVQQPRRIGVLLAPTVVGEMGFFSGEKRSASVKASTDLKCTEFSAEHFEKLKKKNPQQAMDALFAAIQIIIHYLVQGNLARAKQRLD